MLKITCITTFMDGRDRFEAGESLATEAGCGCRVITADQAERFVAAGWAKDGSGDVAEAAPAQALTINDGQHGQEASHG